VELNLPAQWRPGRQLAGRWRRVVSVETAVDPGETEAHVWAQLEVAHATGDVLVVGVVQVTVENLLGQGKRTF